MRRYGWLIALFAGLVLLGRVWAPKAMLESVADRPDVASAAPSGLYLPIVLRLSDTADATPVPTIPVTPQPTIDGGPTATSTPVETLPPTPTPTPTQPGDLTLTGMVYSSTPEDESQSIQGATVSVIMCAGISRRFSATTGFLGQYSLLLPGMYLNQCNQVTLEVWATGYETLVEPVSVADLRANPARDLLLVPILTSGRPVH